MNRNIYDTDCVTWSPQGRIFQIEYAAESVKLGTCVVGLRSQTHAVVVAIRRDVSKLADFNDKVLMIDKHVGATFSGITSDAGLIVRNMRSQCLRHKFLYDSPAPIEKLVLKVAQTSQENTLSHGKRPFGVGLLIAGYDNQGPHIFETVPSGDYYEHYAQAFGARCQAAKTFLESHLEEIKTADAKNLVNLALRALASTASGEHKIAPNAVHAGIVGEDREWTTLGEDEIGQNLNQIEAERNPPAVEATS